MPCDCVEGWVPGGELWMVMRWKVGGGADGMVWWMALQDESVGGCGVMWQ